MTNRTTPEIFNQFIDAFEKSFNEIKVKTEIFRRIKDPAETTRFYKDFLFPSIAQKLNFTQLDREYLRIDITLSTPNSHGHLIPMIVTESENDPKGDLPNEIHKLLSINCPIKILITRDLDLQNEIDIDHQGHEDSHWYYIIDDFYQANRFEGVFCVISAVKWDEKEINFDFVVYTPQTWESVQKGERKKIEKIHFLS